MKSKDCDIGANAVIVHKGYHFWWCSTHNQPLYQCEIDVLQQKLNGIVIAMANEPKPIKKWRV